MDVLIDEIRMLRTEIKNNKHIIDKKIWECSIEVETFDSIASTHRSLTDGPLKEFRIELNQENNPARLPT